MALESIYRKLKNTLFQHSLYFIYVFDPCEFENRHIFFDPRSRGGARALFEILKTCIHSLEGLGDTVLRLNSVM